MSWSWRLGSIRGIEIKVHVTFLFALAWGAFSWGGGRLEGMAYGALLTLALFALVVLHELGHSLAARRYGIPVHDILLLPIGGVARLSRMPEKPQQELVVALAGPAVNLLMILILLPIVAAAAPASWLTGGLPALPAPTSPGLLNFAAFLLMVNTSLLLFNMLPAFPMDGGRVLRALLAMKLPYVQATKLAMLVGRGLAVLFGIYGILSGNFWFALIALFVFSGAGAEWQEASYRERLREIPVSAAIDGNGPILPADLPAYTGFERLARSPYPALAVVDQNGQFLGVVTRAGLQRGWARGVRGTVDAFVERLGLALDCDTPLDVARQRMADAQAWIAAVYCKGQFSGLLDWQTISRVAALSQSRGLLGHLRQPS